MATVVAKQGNVPNQVSLSSAQVGAAASTNVVDRGAPSDRGAAVVITTTTNTAPTNLARTAVAGGGTFAANTYFWKVTAVSPAGESVGSNEVTVAIALNGHCDLTWDAVAGATSYKVYRSTTTNTELLVADVGNVLAYSDTGTAASGAIPTTTPTCTYAIQGSVDGTNWFPLEYADSATPATFVTTTFAVTSATTKTLLLPTARVWRYLRINYSANTNVTNTADVYI